VAAEQETARDQKWLKDFGAAQPVLMTVAVDRTSEQQCGQSLAQFQFFYDLGIGSLCLGGTSRSGEPGVLINVSCHRVGYAFGFVDLLARGLK
jgi:hypothetical protein